jgi:hypothetical protein
VVTALAGAVFGAGDLQAEDFAVSVGVDAGGEQGVDVDDPAAFADFEHEGVGGDERVRAGDLRPGAERRDVFVEVAGHHADLRLRQAGDPQRLDQLVHPTRGHAEQVTRRDDGGQGCFGPFTALQQPIGEIRTGPEFRDGDVEGSRRGCRVAVPVAVAGVVR